MSPPALARFVAAQDAVLAQAEAELSAGHKRTHWMWFVFPQIAGLGHSPMARTYAIADLDEARRYLADPVLGTRLRRHVEMLLAHRGRPVREILGEPDDMKLRSCLTLFRAAAEDEATMGLLDAALDAFFWREADPLTRKILDRT